MFQNVFSTSGRIRRLEFVLSQLIYVGALMIIILFASLTKLSFFYFIAVLVWIVGSLFRVIQGAKRCHDLGNSGWFQFIPFYFIVMIFADGERRDNKYGPNPKGKGNYNSINEIGQKEY
ncbi:DUF805 domain-containing protein [Chryseobacterium gambrini]|uniref:DUF805 domain-containing protein n=1 Tax=Chryseobacterium gambrini TaxID=373672 RepID=UPI0022F39A79|nr:DUF805 domain-containing protein [Chryseobacterium gambrini]WBX98668.1 DUF805 domain-containing protein [Chryseobacterium gambrini]